MGWVIVQQPAAVSSFRTCFSSLSQGSQSSWGAPQPRAEQDGSASLAMSPQLETPLAGSPVTKLLVGLADIVKSDGLQTALPAQFGFLPISFYRSWLLLRRFFIFYVSKITADGDGSHEIKSCLLLGRKVMTNLDSLLKSRDIYFANKGPSSQSYGFSNSHVWMQELDYKGKLSVKELMLVNCGFGEDSWESLELQGDPTSPS